MKRVVVVGEVLVEIMADSAGEGFRTAQALTGPFPSGAPAIFADQMAKLGQPVALIAAVGQDDFGQLNLDRLTRDGVDVSAVYRDPDRPTGSAFVRYRPDGGRDFVFNIRHSAAGQLHRTEAVERLLASADHLHVMGSSLSSPDVVALNLEAARRIRARGGSLSFDPNLRKELLATPGLAEAAEQTLAMTDLFLPSGAELTLFTRAQDDRAACAELLASGVSAIVHKQGTAGAHYIDRQQQLYAPAFAIEERDPTGAGDCFGATFTALWLRGSAPGDALRLAAASGALAVHRRGPMEGTASLVELHRFLAAQPGAAA